MKRQLSLSERALVQAARCFLGCRMLYQTRLTRLYVGVMLLTVTLFRVATTDAYGQDASNSISRPTTNVKSSTAPTQEPFQPGLIRVDFSISSHEPCNWDGELSVSRGSFANAVPLGSSAASPTDFLPLDQAQDRLVLHTKVPTTFCGVETTIFAPQDSRLELKLTERSSGRSIAKTIFVNRLIESSTRIPFDSKGNGIEIIRAPGDDIPVRILKFTSLNTRTARSTIFRPNETFVLEALPRSCSRKVTTDLILVASARLRNKEEAFWSETREIDLRTLAANNEIVGDPYSVPTPTSFQLTTPNADGVFEIVLELVEKTPAKSTFALPGVPKPTGTVVARRSFQCVVVSREKEIETSDALEAVDGDLRAQLLETIDPTNAAWRKSFSKRSLIPFLRPSGSNASSVKANSVKNDKGFLHVPATFADDATDASNQRRFAEIRPSIQNDMSNDRSSSMGERADSSVSLNPASGLVLGQTNAQNDAPLGVNIFNLKSKREEEKRNLEQAEATFRLEVATNWERDNYQRFMRNLDRQTWGLAADLWEKPLSSGSSRPFTTEELSKLGGFHTKFLRLAPNLEKGSASNALITAHLTNDARQTSTSWEAYPIPIQTPGAPHLLEIEYPAAFPQQLGISVLEPSVSGGLFPNSIDFGLLTDDDPLSDRASNEVSRFTALFWPRTKTPIVLISNCSDKTPGAYGQIRVYRADDKRASASTPNRGRVFSPILTQPAICDQFSVRQANSLFGLTGAENWASFEDATNRALFYLSAYNYDALTLAVVSDGSALYPSSILNPSPRYDGGIYLANGSDPVRKDALTYLMAKFEQRYKTLIPLVKLNGTLPALEKQITALRENRISTETRASVEGVEWIGPNGRKVVDSARYRNGSGSYYNILHPVVEDVVLAVIDELASRCASYESFGGLALDVGTDGWLSLPDDVFYGMDDETIMRFVRESNLQSVLAARGDRKVQDLLLAKGADRYLKRAEFIRDVCYEEWLNWRVDALCRFYAKIRETLAKYRPDLRLYLTPSAVFDTPNSQARLYPSLGGSRNIRDTLKLIGLDPSKFARLQTETRSPNRIAQARYVNQSGAPDSLTVLLRPEILAPTFPLGKRAVTDELSSPSAMSLFSVNQAFPGVVFLHKSEERPLYDFDVISPFRPSVTALHTRALPSGYANRRRFASALAVGDQLCFFDGGNLAPFGQESSLRDWVYVFKSLPAVCFKTWTPSSDSAIKQASQESSDSALAGSELEKEQNEKSIQPLVVRFHRSEKETWFYFLNTAPFHLGVSLSLSTRPNAAYELFAGLRREEPKALSDGVVWNFTQTPYDLVAIRVEDPTASIDSLDVTRPVEVCGEGGRLQRAVEEYIDRALVAQRGVAHELRNANFEESYLEAENKSSDLAPQIEKNAEKQNLLGVAPPRVNLFKKSDSPAIEFDENTARQKTAAVPPNPTQIPGWRAFGPNEVDVRLDNKVVFKGAASLKISSTGAVGGVLCQPFTAPTTGRLCFQIAFGVLPNEDLPLAVCLTGRRNGKPFNRRISVGDVLLQKARAENRAAPNGVVWIQDQAIFDRLPFDGLENLSLRFELNGKGQVWIDEINALKIAFTASEQPELMRLINTAEYRLSKDRVTDLIFMFDGYWAKALKEEIPSNSELLANRPRRPAFVTEAPEPQNEADSDKAESPGIFDRTLGRLKFW